MNRIAVLKIFTIAATAATLLSTPALSQFNQKKGGGSAYPVENHPKVDEKAYKAALDRIPEPDKKYDPWGVARPSEPTKATRKSN